MRVYVRRFVYATLLLHAIALVGCAGVRGYGDSTDQQVSELSVVRNPKVIVPLFERDLVRQLRSRGIVTHVVHTSEDATTPLVLRYSARRSLGTVTEVRLSLYENNHLVADIDWDAGRSPMPAKVPKDVFKAAEFWQTAEALAGLFGEIRIK